MKPASLALSRQQKRRTFGSTCLPQPGMWFQQAELNMYVLIKRM